MGTIVPHCGTQTKDKDLVSPVPVPIPSTGIVASQENHVTIRSNPKYAIFGALLHQLSPFFLPSRMIRVSSDPVDQIPQVL